MDFRPNISPIVVIKKMRFWRNLFQSFTVLLVLLVLLINGIKTHGKNLMS